MEFTFSRRKYVSKFLSKSKKRRCTNVNSHVNNSESNNSNTSNIDNVIGNSKLPLINAQTESYFNTFINLKKVTYTEPISSVNDESPLATA